jgi:hypothetical protein
MARVEWIPAGCYAWSMPPVAGGGAWHLGLIWAWTGRAGHGSGEGVGARHGGAVAAVVDQLGGPSDPRLVDGGACRDP